MHRFARIAENIHRKIDVMTTYHFCRAGTRLKMLTPALCSRTRALTGSTEADTSNQTLVAGTYAKTTERGCGLYQCFVRPTHVPATSKFFSTFQPLFAPQPPFCQVFFSPVFASSPPDFRRLEPSTHVGTHNNTGE